MALARLRLLKGKNDLNYFENPHQSDWRIMIDHENQNRYLTIITIYNPNNQQLSVTVTIIMS